MASKKTTAAKSKLTRALKTLETVRSQLEAERKKAKRGQSAKIKKQIDREINSALEQVDKQAKKVASAAKKILPQAPKGKQPKLLKERELHVRGYWDRYPKSDQKRYPNRYAGIPKSHRRGPTAFDLLLRDYNSFTPAQRRRLQLRIAYGVNKETGKILSPAQIEKLGLIIDLVAERRHAENALSRLLVRAGVVDTPTGWKINNTGKQDEDLDSDTEDDEIGAVPLGIQWWEMPQ